MFHYFLQNFEWIAMFACAPLGANKHYTLIKETRLYFFSKDITYKNPAPFQSKKTKIFQKYVLLMFF